MFLTIASFLLLLGILMFFHELGHYLIARRSGIVVEEFGIFGFPPRLAKLFTYDGTDFTLNAIPLGAFVRMRGEDVDDMRPGSFNAASARGRAATLAAGPIMNFILAIVFSIAAIMAGFPAPVAMPQVESVAADSLAAQIGIRPGDILLRSGNQPIYIGTSFAPNVRIQREQAAGDNGADKLLIVRKGNVEALPLPGKIAPKALLAGISAQPVLDTQVTFVVADSPAGRAGLQPGDITYAVNDEVVTPDRPLNVLVSQHLGEQITLTLLRDQRWIHIDLVPRADPPPGQAPLGIGITSVSALVTLPFFQAVWQGIVSIVDYVQLVISLPVMLVMGRLAPSDAGLTGPVGIAQLVGDAVTATADTGLWFPIWQLAATISAGLAIANLLPFPALDGGRLLFIAIEKLRGRRIDPEKEGLIHLIGFALLLGIMVFVTISDIRSGPQGIDWSRILGR